MRIAYVGPYLSGKAGSAGLQRALGIAESLVAGGATVMIALAERDAPSIVASEGISFHPVGEGYADNSDRFSKGRTWLRGGGATVAWLDSMPEVPDAVLIYGGGAIFARRVLRWSESAGAAAIIDCVEWYDTSHQPLGRFGPFALDHERAMRRTYAQANHVICISTLLSHHFRGLGSKTLVVPPTTDVRSIPWARSMDRRVCRFAYAGTPGRKDLLGLMMDEMRHIAAQVPISLDVVGPSPEDLAQFWSDGAAPEWLTVHGKVSRAQAMDTVRGADFTVLFRPQARYANAGFPTKVVESMASGTPVVCNLTSDLGRHITDGKNGVVSASPKSIDIRSALQRAASLPQSEREAMRKAARSEAERSFDFRGYTNELTDFVDSAVRSRGDSRR